MFPDENYDAEIADKIRQLQQKYSTMGQDMSSYLEGLLHADFLTYWDYVHLDTLLSLQTPRTHLKDEMVFIIYHQITELYFKLILWEIKQLGEAESLTEDKFILHVKRVVNYFTHLVHSFEIMIDGMDPGQFLKFRMSLLPASGFQSAQYRMIEMACTSLRNLLDGENRERLQEDCGEEELCRHLYWKKGATELATGKRTLTLDQFEKKYTGRLLRFARNYADKNIEYLFLKHFQAVASDKLIEVLRRLDYLANVEWTKAHFKAASRYLRDKPEDIAATGGTNWQKYLPPKNQQITYFPSLWSLEEKESWGRPIEEVFQKV